jgi:hypothetical protein
VSDRYPKTASIAAGVVKKLVGLPMSLMQSWRMLRLKVTMRGQLILTAGSCAATVLVLG